MKLQPDIVARTVIEHMESFRYPLGSKPEIIKNADREEDEQKSTTIPSSDTKQSLVGPGLSKTDPHRARASMNGGLAFATGPRSVSVAFRPPWWLTSVTYAWSLSLERSWAGWRAQWRHYSVRPDDSPVFAAVYARDVQTLMNLFDSREATPFDCDEGGQSLIHVRFSQE